MSITANSFYQLSETNPRYGSFIQLTSTVGVLLYGRQGGNYFVRKVTISGNSIASVSAATDTGLANYNLTESKRLTKITDTKVLIKVQTSIAASYLQVVDVSGATPSVGTAQNLGTNANSNDFDIYGISATAAIHVYYNTVAADTYAGIVSISGTTITDNTQYQLDSVGCSLPSICDLGGGNYAAIYKRIGYTLNIYGVHFSVSGTVITPQSPVLLSSEGSGSIVSDIHADVFKDDGSEIVVSYVWRNGAGSLDTMYAGIIGVSGTTLSAITNKATINSLIVGSGGMDIYRRTAQYDNGRATMVYSRGTGGAITYYLVELKDNAGTLTKEDQVSLGTDTTYSYWSSNRSILPYIPVYRVEYSTPYIEMALYELDVVAVNQKVLSLSTPNLGGDYLWATSWDGTNIQLQQYDINTLLLLSETDLGAVSDSELEVDYVAYVTQYDDNNLVVFGRMNAPAGLTGVHHIIASTDGGSSWLSVESGWLTDLCVALNLSITGQVIAIREIASDEAQVYVGDMTKVYVSATIPMSVSLGGLNRTVDGTILLASDQNQAIKVLRSVAPYTTFEDITSNLAATGCKKVIGL